MKVRKFDGSDRRLVLTEMIVRGEFLAHVAPKWEKEGMFPDEWCNLIGSWCVSYYDRYDKPPKANVVGMYESWATKSADAEKVRLVGEFLSSLNGDYERRKKAPPLQYVIDRASDLFKRARVEKTIRLVQGSLDQGKVDDAYKAVIDLDKPQVGSADGYFLDEARIRSTFHIRKSSQLIEFPGDMGVFFGPDFSRDNFVVFAGMEKVGKSTWLLDVAWRAMLQRRHVCFFEVGDMSDHQINMRFLSRAAMRPERPGSVRFPVKLIGDQADCHVEFADEQTWDKPITEEESVKAMNRVLKEEVRSNKHRLRLSCHPNGSIGAEDIRSILKGWRRRGFPIDCVFIDYADLLTPPPGFHESARDQINASWKIMRRISQEFRCCVVTATQTDADSYEATLIRKGNFSDDKRKNAHCTAMYGINQKDDEKENGVFRINVTNRREGAFSERRFLYVAGSMAVASPAMLSLYPWAQGHPRTGAPVTGRKRKHESNGRRV